MAHATQNLKRLLCNVRTAAYVTIQLVPKCHYITWLNMHDQSLNFNVNNALNNWWSLIGQTQHTGSGIATLINMETPQDLNNTDVPTEESRIESQTENTEEISNERAEEQKSQSSENEHETQQLDPTSREATIAATAEPQNEQRRQLPLKNQHSL